MSPTTSGTSPQALFFVRMALISGVAIFSGITWYLHSTGALQTRPQPEVGMAILGLQAALLVAVIFFSRRQDPGADPARRATVAIIGWALGEAAAFAGLVYYFVSGDASRAGIGLLIFVAALIVFPIPMSSPSHR